ncbi:MAG: transcriptional regulator, GntR family protein [Marmoricola sp.]|nr:transcriptional regulator, GntR family protein [Marmoricola sp.]
MSATSFEMPRRASRADGVARAVEQRITEDDLAPGFRLGTRAELVASLGVAPSTVSEAIKLLEDRGRVTTKTGPGGGVFVAEPGVTIRLARSIMSVTGSASEVADALEVRNVLELAVIINAAETTHSGKDLEGLIHAMSALRAAANTAEFFRTNLEFHGEVAQLCSNDVLRKMYTALLEIVQSHEPRLAFRSDQDQAMVNARRVQVHQDIADAIATGDVPAARKAAQVHGKQLVPHGQGTSRPA